MKYSKSCPRGAWNNFVFVAFEFFVIILVLITQVFLLHLFKIFEYVHFTTRQHKWNAMSYVYATQK